MLEFELQETKRKDKICRRLISGNIIGARQYIVEDALEEYRFADRYGNDDAIINARFTSRINDEVKILEADQEITSARIVKYNRITGASLFSPRCNYCKNNLIRVGVEIIRKRKKESKELFYFCDECGFICKKKRTILTNRSSLRSFR